MPLYLEQPSTVMAALAENGWLASSACFFLGNWFGNEGPHDARACIGQIVARTRPTRG